MSNISSVVLSGIDSKETSSRQVPKQDFSKVLKESISITSRVLANGVAIVSPEVDVSKSIVSTINKGLTTKSVDIQSKNILSGDKETSAENSIASDLNNQSASTSDLLNATRALQEANWQFSLEYLNLQEKVQNENRYFSTVSNIMRTRHDSAKNAINNMR